MAALIALAGCGAADESEGRASGKAVTAAPARIEIRPGRWEVQTVIVSVSQAGLPHEIAQRMKGPRRTVRHCISRAQAARPDAIFLAARRNGRCSDEAFEMSAGRTAGTTMCRAEDGAVTRLRMHGRYAAERYELRTQIETPGIRADRMMTLITRQSGRRVGDCEPPRGEIE